MKNKLIVAIFLMGVLFSSVAFAQTMLYDTATEDNDALMLGVPDNFWDVMEYSGTNNLLVYPNPVASNTKIVLNELSTGIITVYVIDMNGNIDRTYQYPQGLKILDVDMSTLPQGLYSVRVSAKGIDDHNLKVMKQ